MIRLAGVLAVASLLAAVPSSLSAEPAKAGTRQQLHKWMGCVAKKHAETARAVTLGEDGAMEKLLTGGQMFDRACAPGTDVSFKGVAFLDPIAESVLRREFKSSDLIDLVANGPMVGQKIAADLKSAKENKHLQALDTVSRLQMGLCVLQRDEDKASNLLATPVDSEAEEQAVQAMAPAIEQCLAKDYKSELTFDELRGAIATIRFRLLEFARRGGNHA